MTDPKLIGEAIDSAIKLIEDGERDYAGMREFQRKFIEVDRERRALIAQRVKLLAALEQFGHKSGCRKNAFGDECTCGVEAAIIIVKETK